MIATDGGSAVANARVSTPVPHDDHQHRAVVQPGEVGGESGREVVGVALEAERHEQLVVHVEHRRGLDVERQRHGGVVVHAAILGHTDTATSIGHA